MTLGLASPTAAVLLFAATVAAQTPPPATAPSPSMSAGSAGNGKSLYLKYSCYACHGYDGHGGGGARLVPMRMNLPGFSAYIKSMPESPPAGSIPLLSRIISEK